MIQSNNIIVTEIPELNGTYDSFDEFLEAVDETFYKIKIFDSNFNELLINEIVTIGVYIYIQDSDAIPVLNFIMKKYGLSNEIENISSPGLYQFDNNNIVYRKINF